MKIKQMKPLNRLKYWIEERESIRISREKGESKPWTYDSILRSYRFCNVRRMDDKVSRWLLKNWYEQYKDHHNILLIVALARFINKPESLTQVTEIAFADKWNPSKLVNSLREYRDQGNVVFNGAYMVRGNDGIDKIDCVINHYISSLYQNKKVLQLDETSMEESHQRINSEYGYGSFMAGQIVSDLRWAKSGSWGDKNNWAPVGPGSSRGMYRLMGEKPKTGMKQIKFERHLCDLMGVLKNQLPNKLTNRLEAIDYQNCLCEFDKYERVLWGEGRPKCRFAGVQK